MAESVQLTPEQKSALQAFAAKYPDFDYADALSGGRSVSQYADPGGQQKLIDFAKLKQVLAPAMKGSHFTESGDIQKNLAWWKQALLGAAVVGAPGLAYAALPAGASAAGAGGSSAAAGGTTAATVGTTAAATTPSLLHSLLPTIIGAGATLAGTGIAAHANTEASKLQAAQADKALEIQKQQYALQRQDTAPYRALGQGAVGNLGFLAGIDTQASVPALSSTVPTTPYGQTAAPTGATPAPAPTSLGSLGRTQPVGTPDSGTAVSRGSSGLVSVRNPATGLVHLIPADQVSAAQQRGGVLV